MESDINVFLCYNYFDLHFQFYSTHLAVKLNGGRRVVGILRGFDPFMNMVIDESIEECKDGTKNNIGMVVSFMVAFYLFSRKYIMRIKYFCNIIINAHRNKLYIFR